MAVTQGRFSSVAREALTASTGSAKLAGIVREALLVGVGLAGRIRAQSSAQGSVTTTFAGLVLAGRAASLSKARAGATLVVNLAGKITTQSIGIAYIPTHITVAGRSAMMARARLAQLGQNLVGGRATVQTKASGLVNLAVVPISRQWATVINTG